MKKGTKVDCRKLIDELNTDEKVKDVLRKINIVAESNNKSLKKSVKHLFITSPSCKELSKIAQCYERIITTNFVYPVRGTRTYLELEFPASAPRLDYLEFFASPVRAAATQNQFSGVFLLSFGRWKGARELIQSEPFGDLVNYIEETKDFTSFVFHVPQDFKDAEMLANELEKHVNICQIEHALPDLNVAVDFTLRRLLEVGMECDASGVEELRNLLEEKIDFSSASYGGYETLEKLVSGIQFELFANNGGESAVIGREEVRAISSSIKKTEEHNSLVRKVGFN